MDTVRRPLCGVLCFRAWWEASSENPWAFGGCLPPARPEKAWPFQAGQSPCTKHPRLSSFAFPPRKKFLRVPRGVFSKTLPWQGVGQGPTKGEGEPVCKVRLFRRDKVSVRNTPDCPAWPLHTKKVFGGSKGRFFKNAPLAGGWDSVPQRESKPIWPGMPFQAGQSPFTKRPQTVRLCLYTPKKFLRVPRGVFSKTHLGRGWDRVPQKGGRASHRGAPFQAGQSPCTKHPRLSSFAFTHRKSF